VLAHAQNPSIPDTGRVIVLSSRVGPTIDPDERQMFNLFEGMLIHICGSTRTFRNAVVLQFPDSTFRVRFTVARENEPPKDTLVTYSYEVLWHLAERIEHLEEIQNGKYQPGQRPPPLLSASGEMAVPRTEAKPVFSATRGNIPFAPPESLRYPRYYPALDFGLGLRTYSPDLSGTAKLFGKTPSFGISPLASGFVEVRIADAFAIQAEGAVSLGGTACNQFTAGGSYFVPLVPTGSVQLFVNASVLLCSFRAESSGLVVEAGGSGFAGTAGVEFTLGQSGAVDVYGTWCSLPTIGTTFVRRISSTEQERIPASINLSSLIFGLRLVFFE